MLYENDANFLYERPRSTTNKKRRGSLFGLFELTSNKTDQDDIPPLKISIKKQRQRHKPLPNPPILETKQVQAPGSSNVPLTIPLQGANSEIKRICIPHSNQTIRTSLMKSFLENWVLVNQVDDLNMIERYYLNEKQNIMIRGCTNVSVHFAECCSLCEPHNWIFQGSQYDPNLSKLYAQMDGCIPSSVLLTKPKFIVPWRYRNRKTGAVSW
jgi:hypothetical protein